MHVETAVGQCVPSLNSELLVKIYFRNNFSFHFSTYFFLEIFEMTKIA